MYIRQISRKRADGSRVRYLQLAQKIRDPETGIPRDEVLYHFGREETIDKEQIDDIMAGKDARPPADWTDSGSGSGTDSGSTVAADDAKPAKPESGSIGGPASQH